MTRIFPSLAIMSLGLFAVAVVLGLSIGDLYARPPAPETLHWRGVHMLTGTAAALAVVFVHSIAITYFVGTSRWCKEVTETYRLDTSAMIQSVRLKRQTFPWCVTGMLTVVAVGALGAAADPGTGRPDTASMTSLHFASAWAGLALVGWTYLRVWLNVAENQAAIEQLVEAVQVIRRERGLDEPQAPADEAKAAENV